MKETLPQMSHRNGMPLGFPLKHKRLILQETILPGFIHRNMFYSLIMVPCPYPHTLILCFLTILLFYTWPIKWKETEQWQKQSNLETSELSGNVVVKYIPILKSKKKMQSSSVFFILITCRYKFWIQWNILLNLILVISFYFSCDQ